MNGPTCPRGIVLCEETQAAEWIPEALTDIWEDDAAITALVPGGYESYARVLYPASGPVDRPGRVPDPVPWRTVARWCDRVAHHEMQFRSIACPAREGEERPWEDPPGPDSGRTSIGRLVEAIAANSVDPDPFWALLWRGHGVFDRGAHKPLLSPWTAWFERLRPRARSQGTDVSHVPTFHVHRQEYYLVRGSSEAMRGLVMHWGPFGAMPSYWWNSRRTWFLATHFDFDCAYLAGSAGLARTITTTPDLEVWRTTEQASLRRDPINQ